MATEIQKNRNRQIFIDAAKAMVRAEGIRSVSVRKIADSAGFSYATIYGYFKDLDHLLWHVTMDCIGEIVEMLKTRLGKGPYSLSGIEEIYASYAGYFLENPTVFELLFYDQIGPPPEEFADRTAEPQFALMLLEGFEDRSGKVPLDREGRNILARTITSSVHGTLLMHLSNKSGKDSARVIDEIGEMLRYLLG